MFRFVIFQKNILEIQKEENLNNQFEFEDAKDIQGVSG